MNKIQEKLITSFISHISEHGKKPGYPGFLADKLNMKESTLQKYFNSTNELEKFYWKELFRETIQDLETDEAYGSYSVNEKLLALYFTWIEKLKPVRKYAEYVMKVERFYELYPACFEDFKKDFEVYVSDLVVQGVETEEIASRKFITGTYAYLLWSQPVSILKFWIKDDSTAYEDTDALIEKTVNFSFDLMRSNSMDSLFDLAKFRVQHFKL